MRNLQTLSIRIGSLADTIEPALIEDKLSHAILQFHSNELDSFLASSPESQKTVYLEHEIAMLQEEIGLWEINEAYGVCITIRDLITEKSTQQLFLTA